MDLLPTEIIEYILSYLDGYSLIRAAEVCTGWKYASEVLFKSQRHWKTLCFCEIPRTVLLELTVKKYPFWRPNSADDELNWRDLYKTWLNWKLISNFQYFLEVESEHKTYYVTCLKVTGEAIVVGLNNGEINSWKTFRGDPYLIAKHQKQVTCIDIISVIDERPEATGDRRLRYVVSTSHDRIVKFSLLIEEGMESQDFDICQHPFSTVSVRGQQSYFAILDANGTISVWLVEAPKDSGVMPTVHLVANYQHLVITSILSLDIWGDTVTGMAKSGLIVSANFYKSKDKMSVLFCPQNFTVNVTIVEEAITYSTQLTQKVEVIKSYNWRNEIFMYITDTKKIWFSLNGFHYYEYDTNKVLQSYPKSVLLYGNLLILGMMSGSIYMYYLEAPEGLMDLNLRGFHWHHPVMKSPVMAMDIYEDTNGPLIAVLGQSQIYLIQWKITLEDTIESKFL